MRNLNFVQRFTRHALSAALVLCGSLALAAPASQTFTELLSNGSVTKTVTTTAGPFTFAMLGGYGAPVGGTFFALESISGAIYTSNIDGSIVNQNHYDDCDNVYLNGGPINENGPSLPVGEYYFQVTTPSGDLLSTDDVRNRRILVSVAGGAGRVSGSLPDPEFPLLFPGHQDGLVNGTNGSLPVLLGGLDKLGNDVRFAQTTNPGGEYKVWITRVSDYELNNGFQPGSTKTDNFNCDRHNAGPPQQIISGVKYNDVDGSGTFTIGDLPIEGWEIIVNGEDANGPFSYSTFTDGLGAWSALLDEGSDFVIEEVGQVGWVQTGPLDGATAGPATALNGEWSGTVGSGAISEVNFFNRSQSNYSGAKYNDLNGNGSRDGGEPGIAGWSVRIQGTSGGDPVDVTVQTNANGDFDIWLDEGTTFDINEVQQTGWLQTDPTNGETAGDATADVNRHWTGTVGVDDNAGILFGNIETFSIEGDKYYDANVNGGRDLLEVGVAGVRIVVTWIHPFLGTGGTTPYTTTDASGHWIVTGIPNGSSYTVTEILPGTGEANCSWMRTAPTSGSHTGTIAANVTGKDFGNVCVCTPSGGFTLGFWSNKNGQDILKANDSLITGWRPFLNGLNLRNASGANYDVPLGSFSTSYTNFRNWLLNATAVNMAYMLSAQLAANTLDTKYKGLSAGTVVLLTDWPGLAACYGSNVATIGTVQTQANDTLGVDGYTPDGDPLRGHQECLKNILDAINNNRLRFVEPAGDCDVVYPTGG